MSTFIENDHAICFFVAQAKLLGCADENIGTEGCDPANFWEAAGDAGLRHQ